MDQLMSKKQLFTNEVHLTKDDPNYGKPLEGWKRVKRRRPFFLSAQFNNPSCVDMGKLIFQNGIRKWKLIATF